MTAEDLALLLSWSDKDTSQVEFGAHQAILVRSEAAKDHLPPPLNRDSGLVLTVPQAKGLEFDDVSTSADSAAPCSRWL